MKLAATLMPLLLLAACNGTEQGNSVQTEAFDGIAASETVYLTGTEPFWSAELANGEALYKTPENIDGLRFPTSRFAGLNGVAFSGMADGQRFDATVTPGECSDGMSDRTYPFTVTLLLGEEQRTGCAWTDLQPYSGPETP